MVKAEDDWTAQLGKDSDEEVDNNDGEKSGGYQEEDPSDHDEEQASEWKILWLWCHVLQL